MAQLIDSELKSVFDAYYSCLPVEVVSHIALGFHNPYKILHEPKHKAVMQQLRDFTGPLWTLYEFRSSVKNWYDSFYRGPAVVRKRLHGEYRTVPFTILYPSKFINSVIQKHRYNAIREINPRYRGGDSAAIRYIRIQEGERLMY